MTSVALHHWRAERLPKLDEIESSHAAVGGSGPGRRFTTLQINQSYAVMLSSQFQGFCRDLHDECADHFVTVVSSTTLHDVFRQLVVQNRRLDRGNPTPGNLGEDFNRFGISFWDSVQLRHRTAGTWQDRLEALNAWRNAISHQDFDPKKLHKITTLTLEQVKQWRTACGGLAGVFDAVMGDYLKRVTGRPSW